MPDQLTGLKNWRELSDGLRSRSPQSGTRLPVAVYMDIGSLLHVNAVLGYLKADEVLMHLTRWFASHFPNMEAARVGGDEFVLLAPDMASAKAVADQVQKLASQEFEEQRKAVRTGAHAAGVTEPPPRLLHLSVALIELDFGSSLIDQLGNASKALHEVVGGPTGQAARIVVRRDGQTAS